MNPAQHFHELQPAATALSLPLAARVARDEQLLEAFRPLLEAHVARMRQDRASQTTRRGDRVQAIPALAIPFSTRPAPTTAINRKRTFPGLRREQLDDRSRHAVASDLKAALLPRGLLGAFKGELQRRAKDSGLTPVACAVLAFLSTLPRPRGRPLGVGVQVSRDWLALMVGCSRRSISYALASLENAGYVERFRVLVDVPPWFDGKVERTRADVYAVTFPTPRALDLVRRWGADLKLLRNPSPAEAPAPTGQTRVRGVVGFLLKRLAVHFRGVARRCAAVREDCTPEAVDDAYRRKSLRIGRESIVKNPSALARHFPSPRISTAVHAALRESAHEMAAEALTLEIERCWDARTLIAATAYPDLWNIDDDARERRRRALERHFEPIRRALTRRLLHVRISAMVITPIGPS